MSNSPKSVPTTPTPFVVPRHLSIVFDSVRLRGISASERAKTIVCLANLLTQATGERDDDKR